MKKSTLALVISLWVISSVLVTFGALFKLQSWPGAGVMLIFGLTMEAVAWVATGVAVWQYFTNKKDPSRDIIHE